MFRAAVRSARSHPASLHCAELGADAADDLVSEAFLIAFRRRAGYKSDYRDASPWLYGIATNLIGRRRREEVRFLRARTAPASPLASSLLLIRLSTG